MISLAFPWQLPGTVDREGGRTKSPKQRVISPCALVAECFAQELCKRLSSECHPQDGNDCSNELGILLDVLTDIASSGLHAKPTCFL